MIEDKKRRRDANLSFLHSRGRGGFADGVRAWWLRAIREAGKASIVDRGSCIVKQDRGNPHVLRPRNAVPAFSLPNPILPDPNFSGFYAISLGFYK